MIHKCKLIEILQISTESGMDLLNIVPWLNFNKCAHKQCLCKNVFQYYLTYSNLGLTHSHSHPHTLEYLDSIDNSANSTMKIFASYIKELIIQDIELAKQILKNLTHTNIESRVHFMYDKLYGDKITKPIHDTLIHEELGLLKYGKVNLQLFSELVVKAINQQKPLFKIIQYFDTISNEGFVNMEFIINDLEYLVEIKLNEHKNKHKNEHKNEHPDMVELSRLLDELKKSLKNLQDPNKYDNL